MEMPMTNASQGYFLQWTMHHLLNLYKNTSHSENIQSHKLTTAIMVWLRETLLSFMFISTRQVASSVYQKWAKTLW